jgi:hypothetical protein
MVRRNSTSTSPSKSSNQPNQQPETEFDEFPRLNAGKTLDNGNTKQPSTRPTHSTDVKYVNHPAQNQATDSICRDGLVDNVDISDQVRTNAIIPSHLSTPGKVRISTSTGPISNPQILLESKTNQPLEWPCTRTQAHVETNPAHIPRTRKLTGDATWPPGRPPSSGHGGPLLGGPEETILRVETDQGAATLAALAAWRKPVAPVSEQEREEAFAALRRIGTSRPSSTQVPSDSHPPRMEPPPHIPASIALETFRDPEADVRTLPQDMTLHTPRTGVRYYTNTEANRRGALLELPRPRLIPANTDEAATNTSKGNNSHSGGPPVELALWTEGAGVTSARTSVVTCSGGGREDLGRGYGQGDVKTPTDEKYLDLVLDGRLTPDDPPRWVDSMIRRIMRQVGPMELRMQVTRGGSSDSSGRRAAGAQGTVDYSGDLTVRGDAGTAASSLTLTLSRPGRPQLRQDEVVDRASRCCTARLGISMDGSSTSAWTLDDVASAPTASCRGLSGSTEQLTMLDGGDLGLHSSPPPGGLLAVGLRSEVSCGGGPPVEPTVVQGCGAGPSHGVDKADTGAQSRNQGDVTQPSSWRGSASDSRPLTDLGGFERPRQGQRASTRGKRWTARVGVTLDGNGSLTARLLEDVTSTPREGGHVWNIALERIVEGPERGEAALAMEDTQLYSILEGPVIGERLDDIRDTANVQDSGSMQQVLCRVLRLLGEVSGSGEEQTGPSDPRILQDVPPLARPGEGGGKGVRKAGRPRISDDLRGPARPCSGTLPSDRHRTQVTLSDYVPWATGSEPEARVIVAPDPVAWRAAILADKNARPAPQSLVQAPRLARESQRGAPRPRWQREQSTKSQQPKTVGASSGPHSQPAQEAVVDWPAERLWQPRFHQASPRMAAPVPCRNFFGPLATDTEELPDATVLRDPMRATGQLLPEQPGRGWRRKAQGPQAQSRSARQQRTAAAVGSTMDGPTSAEAKTARQMSRSSPPALGPLSDRPQFRDQLSSEIGGTWSPPPPRAEAGRMVHTASTAAECGLVPARVGCGRIYVVTVPCVGFSSRSRRPVG